MMALRDYMYAKHSTDSSIISRINQIEPSETDNDKFLFERKIKQKKRVKVAAKDKKGYDTLTTVKSCGSGKELVLSDGSKKCRGCLDCPKIKQQNSSNLKLEQDQEHPKVEVQIQGKESTKEIKQKIENIRITNSNNDNSDEINFTNLY